MPNENKKWKEERRRWRSSRSKGEPPNERGGEALFVFLSWSTWTSQRWEGHVAEHKRTATESLQKWRDSSPLSERTIVRLTPMQISYTNLSLARQSH